MLVASLVTLAAIALLQTVVHSTLRAERPVTAAARSVTSARTALRPRPTALLRLKVPKHWLRQLLLRLLLSSSCEEWEITSCVQSHARFSSHLCLLIHVFHTHYTTPTTIAFARHELHDLSSPAFSEQYEKFTSHDDPDTHVFAFSYHSTHIIDDRIDLITISERADTSP
jgi:hypothetical protein